MAHSRKVALNHTSSEMTDVLRDIPKYSSGAPNGSNRCVPHDVHGGPNADTRAESLYHDDVSYGATESTDVASSKSGHNSRPVDHLKPSPAEEALLLMGIPTDVVHIAVQVIRGRHQGIMPENNDELYNLALDMNENSSLKKKHAQEAKEVQEREQHRGSRNGLSDLEEDGCPSFPAALTCTPNHVPSPSCKDAILEQKCASSFFLPEPSLKGSVPAERKVKGTEPKPEARKAAENQLREREKMQLHVTEGVQSSEDVSAVKAKLERKLRKLEAENRKLQHRKLCRVCRKVALSVNGVTFLPCGHFITCEACSEKLDDCPACGKNIMGTVRTFLA